MVHDTASTIERFLPQIDRYTPAWSLSSKNSVVSNQNSTIFTLTSHDISVTINTIKRWKFLKEDGICDTKQ